MSRLEPLVMTQRFVIPFPHPQALGALAPRYRGAVSWGCRPLPKLLRQSQVSVKLS